MIAQLICFTLRLLLFSFGLFVGVQADQIVGVLLMFAGLAQIVYSFGVGNE